MLILLLSVSVGAVSATESLDGNNVDIGTIQSSENLNNVFEKTVISDGINYGGVIQDSGESNAIYINVTGNDNNEGTLENPYATLNKGISVVSSNNTIIKLGEGIFKGNGNREIIIDQNNNGVSSYYIVGSGVNKTTIDLSHKSLFTINEGTSVYISNLTIKNGYATDGAVFLVKGKIIVENANFEDNLAKSNGGVICGQIGSDITISNSTFSKNKVIRKGGAIYGYNMNISNSIFKENEAYDVDGLGGAIYISSGGKASISDSKFISNLATMQGGSIYTVSGVNIVNNQFINSKTTSFSSKSSGGAIFSTGLSYLKNNTFDNCKAYSSLGDNIAVQYGLSNIKIYVLNGETVNITNTFIPLTALVTDDMGNLVHGASIEFKISGVSSTFKTNSVNGIVSLTVHELLNDGIYDVTAKSSNVQSLVNGKLNVFIDKNPIDVYVSQNGDDINGDGTINNPFKTIAQGLIFGFSKHINVNLHLGDGVFYGEGNVNITDDYIGMLNIVGSKSRTTIDGIDGNFFLNVKTSLNLTISNLIFKNFVHGNSVISIASGVFTQSTFGGINNCIFEDIIIGSQNLVTFRYGLLYLTNSIFRNISGAESNIGSGNLVYGANKVDNCTFYNNKVGGLVDYYQSEASFTNSYAYNNVFFNYAVSGGNGLVFDNNRFISNTGTIISTTKNIIVNNSIIQNNGMYIKRNGQKSGYSTIYTYFGSPMMTFSNSKFINCSHNYAGAIYARLGVFNCINTTFTQNNGSFANDIYLDNSVSFNFDFVIKFVSITSKNSRPTLTAIIDDGKLGLTTKSGINFYLNNTYLGYVGFNNGVATVSAPFTENGKYVLWGSLISSDMVPVNGTVIIDSDPLKNYDVYVSEKGSDEKGDGSLNNPFATILKAYNYALSKNTVTISIHVLGTLEGTGNVNLNLKSDCNVNIIGYDSENSKIKLDGTSFLSINVNSLKYFKLINLTIFGNSDSDNSVIFVNGFSTYIDNCKFIGLNNVIFGLRTSKIILNNSKFYNNNAAFINSDFKEDISICNSEFMNNSYSDASFIYGGKNIYVENTVFDNNVGETLFDVGRGKSLNFTFVNTIFSNNDLPMNVGYNSNLLITNSSFRNNVRDISINTKKSTNTLLTIIINDSNFYQSGGFKIDKTYGKSVIVIDNSSFTKMTDVIILDNDNVKVTNSIFLDDVYGVNITTGSIFASSFYNAEVNAISGNITLNNNYWNSIEPSINILNDASVDCTSWYVPQLNYTQIDSLYNITLKLYYFDGKNYSLADLNNVKLLDEYVRFTSNIGKLSPEYVKFDSNTINSIFTPSKGTQVITATFDDGLKLKVDIPFELGPNEVIVHDWEELKEYCERTDKNWIIYLNDGAYTPSEYIGDQIVFKNNVTIIGNPGSYIGCPDGSEVFQINYVPLISKMADNVGIKLIDVNFRNLYVSVGPDAKILEMSSNVPNLIQNCTVRDVVSDTGHGCVFYLETGYVDVVDSSFYNCTTNFGVLSNYNPTDVYKVHMKVINCTFLDNYATVEPGAINNCGQLIVINSTFTNNSAYWWAGAIHTHSEANSTLINSTFTNNVAGWNGGALYTYSYLQIYNCTFTGNNCTTNNGGGAIGACDYGSAYHITIYDSAFINNTNICWERGGDSPDGVGRGGAISVMDAGSLKIYNTLFVGNLAAIGQAICAYYVAGYGDSPDIVLINNTFINHTGTSDTVIISLGPDISTGATLINNTYINDRICLKDFKISSEINEINVGEEITIDVSLILETPGHYDKDLLDKTVFSVYVNNKLYATIPANSTKFTFKSNQEGKYVITIVPSFYNGTSNNLTVTVTKLLDEIWVDVNGNDNNRGSEDSPFATIEKALKLANKNAIIHLNQGIHNINNQLVINNDVTIVGENNNVIINSNSNGILIVNKAILNLINLTFEKISSSESLIRSYGDLNVDNCIFTHLNGKSMIDVKDGKVNIKNTEISYNKYVALFDNSGDLNVSYSSIIENNVLVTVMSVGSKHLDYNWWGTNNPSEEGINYWVIMNVVPSKDTLYIGEIITLTVDFKHYMDKLGNIHELNSGFDDIVKFKASNGNLSDNIVSTINGKVMVQYTGVLEGVDTILISSRNQTSVVNVNVIKTVGTVISIICSDINVGEQEVILVVLNENNATGNVTLLINDVLKVVNIVNGVGKVIISNLSSGTYIVKATYNGDYKYLPCSNSASFKVNKVSTSVDIKISDIIVGEDELINIILPNDVNGIATVDVNGRNYNVAVVNGKGLLTISNLPAGDYNIKVKYLGDNKYYSCENTAKFSVSKIQSDIFIEVEDVMIGQKAIINVVLPDYATGKVSITVDGKEYIVNSRYGVATLTLNNLSVGKHTIKAIYSGDNKYNVAQNTTTFTVKGMEIKLVVDDLIKYFGGSQRLIAHLVDDNGNPLANAIVVFYINGNYYNRTTDANGDASMAINLVPGTYDVSTSYKDITVKSKVNVKSTIMGEDTTLYFRNGTQYVAKFLDSNGDPLVNKEVKFNINGVFYYKTTDKDGFARLRINLDPNEYIITAYNPVTGEEKSNKVTVLTRLIASDLNMKYHDGSKFKITLVDGHGKVIVGQNVTFNVNGVFYQRTTDASGVASLNINLMAGKYIITSTYGDAWASNKITISS